jgi:serine/threonine protein kinase
VEGQGRVVANYLRGAAWDTIRSRGCRTRSPLCRMQLAINTVVAGRFRLNHLIGRGGMGSVWHATHLGLDIPCAVKFIEGEMAQVPEAQTRFEREAKAAAQLRSPNVVQILDHGICEGTPYIAMELLDGEDLGKRLTKAVRLSPQELHPIVNQVCRALTKAHALGIVHRDLKPDNIFLVRDDDREIAKVLDFGIAKSHSQQLGVSDTTKTGAMLGTPYYMSPEQAQGTKQVDGRSDLWALAVICFRALTGKLPFTSEALGDLLMKIIIGPIPVPSQYGPVPDGFDKWWTKATAREPAERFQSAKDFADSLALVCGVSQVSGIIDRPHLRVVAHQTAAGPGVPPGQADARAQGPQPNPGYGPRPSTETPRPQAAPPPQMMQTGGPSVTPATFGESVPGVPKKTNIGIFVGVGAAIFVTLLTGGGFLVWRSTSTAAGHGTDPGVTPSASVAVAPTPVPPTPVTPPPPVPVEPDPSPLPAPAPPTTAGTDSVEPKPSPPASAAPTTTPKPSGADPGTGVAARPPSSHLPTSHSATPPPVKKPKHEDLGF